MSEIDICSICHEPLSNSEQIYTLPECSHRFHTNCIMHWFRTDHNRCPLCNNEGINFNENNYDYVELRLFDTYYRMASNHCRKKDANKMILKEVKKLRNLQNKQKQEQKKFKDFKNEKCDPEKTNEQVFKELIKLRSQAGWKIRQKIYRKKRAIGHLYYSMFIKNKFVVARRVTLSDNQQQSTN